MLKNNIDLNGKTVLITGAAGFVGANLVMELMRTVDDICIVGMDNMNDYYDVSLKEYRLSEIEKLAVERTGAKWWFVEGNIADKQLIDAIFDDYKFDVVVNLAAQAGVRYSITNPDVYIESNLIGFYTSSRLAVIHMTMEQKELSILYMLPAPVCTEATKRCLTALMTRWITLYLFMRLPRSQTSFWHIPTASCTTFRQQG